jgi:ATP-dependent phosphofructokinase / diphosphate-dependent phosphofructokinase
LRRSEGESPTRTQTPVPLTHHAEGGYTAAAMRIGMLTGGGDCPGLNPVIRAVCRRLWEGGHETLGVLNGWRGMIDGDMKPLGFAEISGILPRGGTIIGTSRTNPHKI